MADTHPEVVFFWLPGCGNCTHLRGYLTAKGVVHRALNVVAEPDAIAAISDPASCPAFSAGRRSMGRWR